jgi:TRAP-type C4-dicarboxylate transport system substrate-binding protein
MFISYNRVEQAPQKRFIDLCTRMVMFKQRWEKLAKELQKRIKRKFPRNKTMCKDKWNAPNSNYKKLVDYHKGTRVHTCFWDLFDKEKEVPFT